jgi:hypothetical protein
MREKFCAETLNYMQRERTLSELNCVFVLFFVALSKSSCFNDETTEDDFCCCFCEE